MLERTRRAFLLAPLACAAIYACGGDDTGPAKSDVPQGYEDVSLEGDVTDETLAGLALALADGAHEDPSQAPVIAKPAAGVELPKATVPELSWTFGPTAHRGCRAPAVRWAGLAPAPLRDVRQSFQHDLAAFTAPLRELLSAPRSAHAHGEPYNGTATLVELTAKDGAKLLRVFTSEQTLTPSQAAWDEIAAAAQPITIKLTSAVFEENRVTADGGPFAGSTTDFTIVQ